MLDRFQKPARRFMTCKNQSTFDLHSCTVYSFLFKKWAIPGLLLLARPSQGVILFILSFSQCNDKYSTIDCLWKSVDGVLEI